MHGSHMLHTWTSFPTSHLSMQNVSFNESATPSFDSVDPHTNKKILNPHSSTLSFFTLLPNFPRQNTQNCSQKPLSNSLSSPLFRAYSKAKNNKKVFKLPPCLSRTQVSNQKQFFSSFLSCDLRPRESPRRLTILSFLLTHSCVSLIPCQEFEVELS